MPKAATQAAAEPLEKPTAQLPPAIEGFDKLMNKEVKAYLDLSKKIGGPVAEQVSGPCAKVARTWR